MSYRHAERLRAHEAALLDLETGGAHLHGGSLAIFEVGPLAGPGGGVDFERIREIVEAGLRRAPRYRQKLARVPLGGRPVWVDDPHFHVLYHLRHTALPVPGDREALAVLVGRILSQRLDRDRPLWECWVVEGLEERRFALVSKVHASLSADLAGADLLAAFVGVDPELRHEATESRWLARPAPAAARLALGEARRRAALPAQILSAAARDLRRPVATAADGLRRGRSLARALTTLARPASATPLERARGPHRRVAWTRFELALAAEIASTVGVDRHDVELACVAGALRSYLRERGEDVATLDVRAILAPRPARPGRGRRRPRRAGPPRILPLPVAVSDPRLRLARVREARRRAASDPLAELWDGLGALAEATSPRLLVAAERLAAARRLGHLLVARASGPRRTVYLEGAPLRELHAFPPVLPGQALSVALASYQGGLSIGLHADADALPDLATLRDALGHEVETLRKLSGEAP